MAEAKGAYGLLAVAGEAIVRSPRMPIQSPSH
jgi:hypothetical protein